jgi:hypothetical protein
MEGEWQEPLEGDGLLTADEDRMNEEANNVLGAYEQDAPEQPVYDAIADDHNPDAEATLSIEPRSEYYNNMGAEFAGETAAEGAGEGRFRAADGERAAYELPKAEEETLLQTRTFKHPRTWRHDMMEKLQVEGTSDVQPEQLLDDLQPQWPEQHPSFLDPVTARVQPQDDVGDIVSSHEHGLFRLKLSKDETGGVERATIAMCTDLLDRFNHHRKLKIWRER